MLATPLLAGTGTQAALESDTRAILREPHLASIPMMLAFKWILLHRWCWYWEKHNMHGMDFHRMHVM